MYTVQYQILLMYVSCLKFHNQWLVIFSFCWLWLIITYSTESIHRTNNCLFMIELCNTFRVTNHIWWSQVTSLNTASEFPRFAGVKTEHWFIMWRCKEKQNGGWLLNYLLWHSPQCLRMCRFLTCTIGADRFCSIVAGLTELVLSNTEWLVSLSTHPTHQTSCLTQFLLCCKFELHKS